MELRFIPAVACCYLRARGPKLSYCGANLDDSNKKKCHVQNHYSHIPCRRAFRQFHSNKEKKTYLKIEMHYRSLEGTVISTTHRTNDWRFVWIRVWHGYITEVHTSVQQHLLYINISLYTVSEKDYTLFLFYFFSRCPVCGEWCKLHWLLLDTPSFDWNPRRSRRHKMFKMAPTKQQKAFCAVERPVRLPLHRQRKDNARCFCLCIGNLSPWVVYANV